MSPGRRIAVALAAAALLITTQTGPAHAAPASSLSTPSTAPSTGSAGWARTVVVIATAADAAATAQPGEGVIRITTRVCGNANNWQQVAAANGISADSSPPYLVLLGQRLTVSCSTSTGSTTAQPAPAPPATAPATGWANPTPGACITSPYGWRQNPTGPGAYTHQGVDLGAGYGVAIHAAAAGTVTRAGWIWSGYGISVTVNHGNVSTHYAHQSRTAVAVGQHVDAGQVIGYVGATGDVTGPHLHFEVATSSGVLGSQIDPVPFMAARGVRLGC